MYPPERLPAVIKWIMAMMAGCFVLQQFFPGLLVIWFGLTPVLVLERFWFWQLATYMFLHGNLIHLLFNLFAIYLFATSLVVNWGEREFLFFSALCGVGAAIITVITSLHSPIPVIGASGAIYGMLYAWARENPNAVVYMYGLFPMRARHMVIFLIIVEFLLSQTPSPIARFAHLGGILVAWLYFSAKGGQIDNFRSWFFKLFGGSPAGWRKALSPQEEIDRILDKINERGISSLTPWEKKRLDEAGKK
ncbi:MAG: rhomboid family intramembrane serine protease [Elusimicrobia bacterium]|nr:rhomboid family intramembrane serine protease [Elusimicrobiota bacterium]